MGEKRITIRKEERKQSITVSVCVSTNWDAHLIEFRVAQLLKRDVRSKQK